VEAARSVAPGWVPHAIELMLPDEREPVTAAMVAGLAVTKTAPASVAVAIEFGRAGGGWAGAIVFNLWLRRKLRERPMSQRQLAALSGVDHSTISRLLRHDRTPSLATATKLAKALRHVRGEQGESDTADYFNRIPEETLFPARRVEMALRADELLDDEDVRRLMNNYLDARRRRQTTASSNELVANGRASAPARAGPTRAAPDPRR
jgi:transcriptional regulator with XRE-family HTH domain